MSLTRRQFLIRAGIASVAGPAVLATTGSGAFAHLGAHTPESPVGSLVLLPKANVNLVGSDHTVTATLRPRRAGETLRFEVSSGPNGGDGGDVVTDDRGRASFTYTGDGGEGLDVITARAEGAGSSGELTATATKEWVALSAITDIDLSSATSVNTVGGEHEVRARLRPRVGGVPVRFEVLFGPNAGLTATIESDDRGRASFAYIGDGGPGTDSIVAWVDVNEIGGVRDDGDPQAVVTKDRSRRTRRSRRSRRTRPNLPNLPSSGGDRGGATLEMGRASEVAPRSGFALRPGLELYRMADGSGVLADLERREGHALNAEAAELLGGGPHWTEGELRDRMPAKGRRARSSRGPGAPLHRAVAVAGRDRGRRWLTPPPSRRQARPSPSTTGSGARISA